MDNQGQYYAYFWLVCIIFPEQELELAEADASVFLLGWLPELTARRLGDGGEPTTNNP